jgi:hypothetical protein
MTAALLIGLVICSMVIAGRLRTYPLPGNQQGYEPEQPIAFSHRQHAGDLQISCLYCHYGAEQSRHAGIPSASICMTCHRFITAPQKDVIAEILEARKANRTPEPVVSKELHKLYAALGLNDKKVELDPQKSSGPSGEQEKPPLGFLQRDPNKTPKPIVWVKVHNLPAYTCFDHRAHFRSGVECKECHGQVENMDRLKQVSDLSMGWCVNCHRTWANDHQNRPSIECATCHH